MDNFVNVIKEDPPIYNKPNDMLERYNKLPHKYHLKIGYDSLNHNDFLKKLINTMGTTIMDTDIELKMKISRTEYLEKKTYVIEKLISNSN